MSSVGDEGVRVIMGRRKSRRNPNGQPLEKIASALSELGASHHGLMIAMARKLVMDPHADEGDLLTLLTALAIVREAAVVELAAHAISASQTRLKEYYVVLLDYLDASEKAERAMASVLFEASQGAERADLASVLSALHARREVGLVAQARAFVSHPSAEVRGAAMAYVRECDDSGAAPAFLKRLQSETDEELGEFLIDALVMWECREAIPQLEEVSRSLQFTQEIRGAAAEAIRELGRLHDD